MQLRVGDASIRLVLPRNSSATYRRIPEARQLHLRLAAEGPTSGVGSRVKYVVAARATRNPATAVQSLDEEVKRAAKASISLVAVPTVDPAVPLAKALAILNSPRELGVQDADFGRVLHGIPDDAECKATVLPSPAR